MRRDDRIAWGIILALQLATLVFFVPLPEFLRDFSVSLAFDHLRNLVLEFVKGLNHPTTPVELTAWVTFLSWLFWVVVPTSWVSWRVLRRWALNTAGISSDSVSIARTPGWGLHGLAKWFFSPRTFTEILEPVLSDLQRDFLGALQEERPYKARWVQIRGYGRFWTHVGAHVPISFGRVAHRLWKTFHS